MKIKNIKDNTKCINCTVEDCINCTNLNNTTSHNKNKLDLVYKELPNGKYILYSPYTHRVCILHTGNVADIKK